MTELADALDLRSACQSSCVLCS